MARGMKKHMDRRLPSTFKIQITSMVDMFVIILVFLLKSYSTSPVDITPGEDLKLPVSSSYEEPENTIKMMVSQKGIFIDDKRVVEFDEAGQLTQKDMDSADSSFIPSLFKELESKAEATRSLAAINDTVTFDGKVFVLADKGLPYSMLKKVMYTSMLAGYSDVKLAVITNQ
jgi:biopolymer transport protein ExbD